MAIALLLVVGGVVAVVAVARSEQPPGSDTAQQPEARAPQLVLKAGGAMVSRQQAAHYWIDGVADEAALRRLVDRAVPQKAVVERRRARIAYRYDRAATVDRIVAAGPDGGVVRAVRRPVASRVAAPVLQQAQRNTCESAALEILLATTGRSVEQARLQRAFPTSGALDPAGEGADRVWGDPDLGYVGRPDGGGVAGGFGVFPGPVRATAKRFGVELDDLSGRSPEAIYARLLRGRAVMAWIGLSDGPYGEWRSPRGNAIRVNFGEHTVVLHGLRSNGLIEVSNPLEGTSETWSKERFEAMWELLDRRALAA